MCRAGLPSPTSPPSDLWSRVCSRNLAGTKGNRRLASSGYRLLPKVATGQPLRSAERLLLALRCFSVERPQLTLTEISQELNLAVSTVRRLLLTLERHGLLYYDANTSHYSVSMRTDWLPGAARAATLQRICGQHLDALHKETAESVILAVLDGGQGVHIDVRRSSHFISAFNPVGFRITPYAGGAIGKVLMAWLPEDHVRLLLPAVGEWKPKTSAAIHNTRELLHHLARVRERGYATNEGETDTEAWTVAAPVFDAQGYVAAALLVPIPQSRATRETRTRLINLVQKRARAMSLALQKWNKEWVSNGPTGSTFRGKAISRSPKSRNQAIRRPRAAGISDGRLITTAPAASRASTFTE